MYVVSLHSFQSISNLQFPFICCLVSWIVHSRTWRKWTPRDFAPWIFMAGKLGGSGKTREIVLHSEIVVSSTIYRLYKYRYWHILQCIGIRYNDGIAGCHNHNSWAEEGVSKPLWWLVLELLGRWFLLKRSGPLIGWVGELDELQTTEPMPICGCLSAMGWKELYRIMHSMQGCYWLFGRKQSWHVEKLSGMMP